MDIARQLLAHGASARVKDTRAQLALHRAAAIGSVPMVKLLLENKSPLNATDIAGYTALHHGKGHFLHEAEWVVWCGSDFYGKKTPMLTYNLFSSTG